MKTNYAKFIFFERCRAFSLACISLVIFQFIIGALNIKADGDVKASQTIKLEDVIGSAKENNLEEFERISLLFASDRKNFSREMLKIFHNPKSSNLNQCAAAYYLGEIRSAEAVDALVANIGLRLDMSALDIHGLPAMLPQFPVQNAVVKIGNPSIPPLINNLETKDDAKYRELSLEAVCRIDGDKDIVKLRLEKALTTSTNSQIQARLRKALKELPDVK